MTGVESRQPPVRGPSSHHSNARDPHQPWGLQQVGRRYRPVYPHARPARGQSQSPVTHRVALSTLGDEASRRPRPDDETGQTGVSSPIKRQSGNNLVQKNDTRCATGAENGKTLEIQWVCWQWTGISVTGIGASVRADCGATAHDTLARLLARRGVRRRHGQVSFAAWIVG